MFITLSEIVNDAFSLFPGYGMSLLQEYIVKITIILYTIKDWSSDEVLVNKMNDWSMR